MPESIPKARQPLDLAPQAPTMPPQERRSHGSVTGMTDREQREFYGAPFIAKLELLWGDGFLSPGGREEVALILEGLDLTGLTVLDVGCGIGGIDLLLVEEHGAARVLGIDVEDLVLEHAMARARDAGLADRLSFRKVAPGPFPLADASFALVFSKDSLVHIPDKGALYAEVLRVLKPGGVFAASDWMRRDATPPSDEMKTWLQEISLALDLAPLDQAEALLRQAGFEAVEVTKRNAWYRSEAAREVERLEGGLREPVIEILGQAGYETWLSGKRKSVRLLERGEFCPGHLRGRKPA